MTQSISAGILSRAQGSLVGQLAGDSLGSLVEFKSVLWIHSNYPEGVRDMKDGGTWNTIAGQATDDSEMALALADSLLRKNTFTAESAKEAYMTWVFTDPFDLGLTINAALNDRPNSSSQANGALMRVCPLGIFGVNHSQQQTGEWARQDAEITHPHPICQTINSLFARAIREAIIKQSTPHEIYSRFVTWAKNEQAQEEIIEVICKAEDEPPQDYVRQQGWVLIALQNALWQLLHAENLEEGVINTIMQGGDTDTNAAIAGALLGAVHGLDEIPTRWIETLLICKPDHRDPSVNRPRPELYWPINVLAIAEKLVTP